ncbi:hypothetical protein DIPPA_25981 [Diplonema papillatum]|nr:hypothetical protein DIPPA_25981 [Diplonema papillatum]
MSQTGTVKSWRRGFGFAEMADNTLVYITQSEIDGGRLRVGRTVSFDTEKVEGHGDRVKGTNVTGEAVLKKDEKLSEEEFAADKKILADARDARKAENEKAFEPIAAEVEKLSKGAQIMLFKKLAKELKLEDKIEKKSKPAAAEEKRADPTDNGKKTYTKAEFFGFYGKKNGEKMWTLAGQKATKSKKARKTTKKVEKTNE